MWFFLENQDKKNPAIKDWIERVQKNGRGCFNCSENVSQAQNGCKLVKNGYRFVKLAKISLIGGKKKQRTDFEVKQKVVFLTLYRKWCIFSIGKTTLAKLPYRRAQKFLFFSKAVLDCTFLIGSVLNIV